MERIPKKETKQNKTKQKKQKQTNKKKKQKKKNSAFGYKGARFEFQFCYLLTRANFLTFLKDCIKNN